MAFTYSPDHATALDRVRFALGDTRDEGHLVEDETIAAEVAARGEAGAVAALAGGLAARLARQPDSVSIPGGPSVRWSRVQALQAVATAAGGGSGTGTAASRPAVRCDDEDAAEYRRPALTSPFGG